MLKIFNTPALTRKQRFWRAVIVAVPATLLLSFVYAALYSLIRVDFSLVYIGIGWLIGRIILETGHGVQPVFSFLAAGLALFCFLFSDTVCSYGFRILLYPLGLLQGMFEMLLLWLSPSISSLISTLLITTFMF